MLFYRTLCIACVLSAASFAASAKDAPNTDMSAPIQIQHSQQTPDVTYVTGGIGFAERNYLASVKNNYSLEIEVALTNGEFVADVEVEVRRGNETVLEATMDGPHLYAALPAGTYVVAATYAGNTKEQSLTIGKTGQRRALFIWKPQEPDATATQKPLPDLHF